MPRLFLAITAVLAFSVAPRLEAAPLSVHITGDDGIFWQVDHTSPVAKGDPLLPGDREYQLLLNHGYLQGIKDVPYKLGTTLRDQDFDLMLKFDTGNPDDAPTIHLQGHSLVDFRNSGTRNWNGYGSGQATSAELSGWTPNSAVPQEVIDAFTTVDRISTVLYLTYGNEIGIYLNISQAPTPVPEPSTLAFFGLALGGLALRRKRSKLAFARLMPV